VYVVLGWLEGRALKRPATIYDVARRAGVSPSTVSRVLGSPEYSARPNVRAAIVQAAQELGYRRNQLARNLKSDSSQDVGVIVPNVTNPYYIDLVRGVEDVAYREGFDVFLCSTDRRSERELQYLRRLGEKRVWGLIVAIVSESSEVRHELRGWQGRAVTFDQTLDEPDMFHVVADNVQGGRLATQHLIGLGHTAIGFVSPPLVRSHRRELSRGYRSALEEAGLTADPRFVHVAERESESTDGIYEVELGERAASALCGGPRRPTAIVAANDMVAIGLLRGLQASGLSVPEDVSVVGYDNIWTASITTPALTTIHQPKYEMGELAAELLLTSRGGTDQPDRTVFNHVLEPKLMVRGSTAAPRSASVPKERSR